MGFYGMTGKNLLILGAGQYGWVAKETALAMGCFDKIDFLDDNNPEAVGKMADCRHLRAEYNCAFAAIGNPQLRLQLLRTAEECQYALPVLMHPQATVMPSAQIAAGSIVEAQAVVNSNSLVGVGCIISAGAVVNHNCVLGSGCHVDCNATIPARSVLPPDTKVPCGTVYQEK